MTLVKTMRRLRGLEKSLEVSLVDVRRIINGLEKYVGEDIDSTRNDVLREKKPKGGYQRGKLWAYKGLTLTTAKLVEQVVADFGRRHTYKQVTEVFNPEIFSLMGGRRLPTMTVEEYQQKAAGTSYAKFYAPRVFTSLDGVQFKIWRYWPEKLQYNRQMVKSNEPIVIELMKNLGYHFTEA
jgi:hypothetical protein